MSYTIANAKTDLEGILKGTSTNKVRNISDLFSRAAREVLLDVDPQETKRTAQIASALFDNVYDYTAPSDLKGNKIIDIRPQTGRVPSDHFSQVYTKEFDRFKSESSNTFQVTSNNGLKRIRIDANIGDLIVINECESVTANGTWVGSNDATNVTTDSQTFASGTSSVNFDVSGATTTATITNSTMEQIDLTDHDEQSTLFAWFYFPDSTAITSVQLKWGNSAAAYWASTATSAFDGAFQNGWNLLSFSWNGATETGSVDPETIDYVEANITYDGDADTDLRLDSITSNLGKIFDIEYYSKFLFRTSGGTWQETTSSDSDIVNLDTESYNMWLFKVAEFCAQQIEQIKDDVSYFKNEYMRSLRRYKAMYKSEVEKPRGSYYRI